MAKPKMPDGLYTRVSQIKTWLLCPRKFELQVHPWRGSRHSCR